MFDLGTFYLEKWGQNTQCDRQRQTERETERGFDKKKKVGSNRGQTESHDHLPISAAVAIDLASHVNP